MSFLESGDDFVEPPQKLDERGKIEVFLMFLMEKWFFCKESKLKWCFCEKKV